MLGTSQDCFPGIWHPHKKDSLLGEKSFQEFEPGMPKKPARAHSTATPAGRGSLQRTPERAKQMDDTLRELEWLCTHREEYAGRWVALLGDTLLADGNSAREVYQQISGRPDVPLVVRVEPAQDLPFAGW